MIALMARQGVKRQTVALIFAPPASSGQGKAPHEGFIFIEQDDLALARLVLELGEFVTSAGQFIGVWLKLSVGR